MSLYNKLRYNIIPPLFIIIFTSSVQILSHYGQKTEISLENIVSGLLGNRFSWSFVSFVFVWALTFLWAGRDSINGPISHDGVVPVYKVNGVTYYISSIIAFLAAEYLIPDFSTRIFWNMPQILGTLNTIALVLCTYLYINASNPRDGNLPRIYLFYRGCDFHPKIFGVDVKQLTNCRVGMILWQLLILSFFITLCKDSSFNFGAFSTLALQSVYLFKFYIWEIHYFHTIDITLDRAGYYLCWGCLVWVQTLFTFPSYLQVKHIPTLSGWQSTVCLLIGLIAIYTQFKVDMEKSIFRATNARCLIQGKKPTWIVAKYKENSTGEMKNSLLLTSGFWGMARHINYSLELVYTYSFNYPNLTQTFAGYLYPIFMTCLLLHRILRDEEKCRNKYGKYWDEYCSKVKYYLIPYIF